MLISPPPLEKTMPSAKTEFDEKIKLHKNRLVEYIFPDATNK